MPVNRYCYFLHAYPLAHFLNHPRPPTARLLVLSDKRKNIVPTPSKDCWKADKEPTLLNLNFLAGRGAGRLAVGMLLCEQIHGNLKTRRQGCWQCHLVLSNSVHCLECGCRLMSFSWIRFLKPLYCYCPTTFHEFGITTASLTPDKEPNKSDLLSAHY